MIILLFILFYIAAAVGISYASIRFLDFGVDDGLIPAAIFWPISVPFLAIAVGVMYAADKAKEHRKSDIDKKKAAEKEKNK